MSLREEVRSQLSGGISVGSYDPEVLTELERFALSLAVLWEVDVQYTQPAVVFFAGDEWEWASEVQRADD
jgi:hypothetical protein